MTLKIPPAKLDVIVPQITICFSLQRRPVTPRCFAPDVMPITFLWSRMREHKKFHLSELGGYGLRY